MDDSRPTALNAARTRRAALRAGGAAAALAALGVNGVAAQSATPLAGGAQAATLLVQGFAHGTLFRTQGSGPDLPPYTIILWGAIGGFVFMNSSSAAGVLPTDRVVKALSAVKPAPTIALIASPAEAGDPSGAAELAWALTLAEAGLGSDPDAVTYQGALLDAADARSQLGLTPSEPPSAVNFGPGYLLVTNAAALDPGSLGGVQLTLP